MNNNNFFLIAFFIIGMLRAQEIKRYEWETLPKFQAIPEQFTSQPAVVLLDKRWVHTRIGQYAFATFVMNHFAVKINKAEQINNFNKVKAEDNGYIRKLRDFHARIIKPNGQIVVLPEDRILEREIDKIKSIVFEGVEAGDILEYYYILKEIPTAFSVEVFQKEVPVLDAEFIYTGSGVNFQIDASSEFKTKTDGDKKYYYTTNIEPFKEEAFSRNKKEIVKLFYSLDTGGNFDNWLNFLSLRYKKPAFNLFSKSKARDFIENLKLDGLSTDQKLQKLDSYIKQNFDFVERGESAKKVKDLNDGKQKLQPSDVFDLYGFTMKELKIPYYIVVGVDRFIGEINSDRRIKGMQHEIMYYIPETKKFISPFEEYLAYGNPMYELQSSRGVAYSPEKNRMEDSNFLFPVVEAANTIISTISNVSLNSAVNALVVKKEATATGYRGAIERNQLNYFKTLKEEKETQDFYKDLLMGKEEVKISNVIIENENFDANYTNTPLKVSADIFFTAESVEEAGNLLVINIGKVIGSQSNLYQEETRSRDLDFYMTKKYQHKIIFTIPEGFSVESYESLVYDKKMQTPNENTFFVSSVVQQGNQLIITTEESYSKIHFSKEQYQEFRMVYNASADFFKGSIVLKKK